MQAHNPAQAYLPTLYPATGQSVEQQQQNEYSGAFDVIRGSGKWSQAKGKGKFIQVIKTPDGSKNVFEMEIITP